MEGFEKIRHEPRIWMILPKNNSWVGGSAWGVYRKQRGEKIIKLILPRCGMPRGVGIQIQPLLSGPLIWVH